MMNNIYFKLKNRIIKIMKQEKIKDDQNKVFISDKLLNFSPYEMMMSDSQ